MDLVSNKVDTGGKRLNLFPAKKQKKKLSVDDKAFNMMEAVADKSYVNISDMSQLKVEKSTKSIHNALMVAGMTPAYGNIADLADATLYALEGEFGDAAWSAAAAIPVIGQMVAGRRAAKVAKEAGEEMVTLFHGVDDWYKSRHAITHSKTGQKKIIDTGNRMVEKGKFVGSGKFAHGVYFLQTGQYSPNQFWVSSSAEYAKAYRRKQKSGRLLEFEVPKSYYNKYFQKTSWSEDMFHGVFPKGIPTQFLKKVHK